jgi:hypothetical protein
MVLKIIVPLVWTIIFFVFYSHMCAQRNHDSGWSREENKILVNCLKIALIFITPEFFWCLFCLFFCKVFIAKFSFSYVFQIKTKMSPTREILNIELIPFNFRIIVIQCQEEFES